MNAPSGRFPAPECFILHLRRVYLKTGEMTSSEGFLSWASHFSAGILAVFQGKMAQHWAKRPADWAF